MKLNPCLWFDSQAEEAATFYVSVFKNSKVVNTTYYLEGGPMPSGSVLMVEFILEGQVFSALNGGPHFKFTPAISIVANCDTQSELDDLWQKLTEGGAESQCGWLTDKYGVSWQVVPSGLSRLLGGSNRDASQRAMSALLTMKKLDVAMLQQAYEDS